TINTSLSVVKGKWDTAVKASADDPHRALKAKGIVDSGCSRHMTGNKAHLADYQEFKGGSVSFGGSNERITGKGKIKAGRFSWVYFLKSKDETTPILKDFIRQDENQFNHKGSRRNTVMLELHNKIELLRERTEPLLRLLELLENQAKKSTDPKEANNSADTQANDDQGANSEEIDLHEEHFVLSIWFAYSTTVKSLGDKIAKNIDFKSCEKPFSQVEQIFLEELEKLKRQEKKLITPISTTGPSRALNDDEPSYTDDPLMPHLEDIYASPSEGIVTYSSYDDEGVVTDFNNLETTVNVNLTPTTRIHSIHPKTQIQGDPIVKTASTPIETQKPLVKDKEAADVDVHLYRSMIGSLMYLTASRHDIKFAVCAYYRFQVTQKTSHLQAVKRIFRYLKGQPKLGLWYPKVSLFDLEAYSDSDYAGANLDKNSTTGGCQFLGRRLISWQCKKQTIVATFTTEAEYVAVAHCSTLVKGRLLKFWATAYIKKANDVVKLRALIDGKRVVVSEDVIREDLRLDDVDGVECLPNEEIFTELARMGYEKPPPKLTFYKAFFDASAVEPTVFDDKEVTMTMDQTLIKMKAEKERLLDEQTAKRLHDEEVEQAAAKEKQEKDDLEKAKGLQQYLKRKPISIAQAMKNMIIYLKNMAGYKMEHFRCMTYDNKKRVVEETLLHESFKKLKAVEVLVSEFKVEALQVKEVLDALWRLVKEKFSTTVPTVNKEKALWVELKRLFKPDTEDVLWKLQRYMHYPIIWKLYANRRVYQVSSTTRRHDMFMLTEKNYPLSNGVMTLMLSAKLQVEEDSDMARDLVMKIFMEANKPKSRSLDTSSK
nr:hypothetical protein [Tanacetum cinerariifolium]